MKDHHEHQKRRRIIHAPAAKIAGAGILVVTCVMAPTAWPASGSDYIAHAASSPAVSVAQQSTSAGTNDVSVGIPTGPPISIDELPEAEIASNIEYVTGLLVSNQPGGKLPVSLTVARETNESAWMKDRLTIGPKEAALTADMLRKDGGNMGVFHMPEADKTEVADLYFSMTQRAAQILSTSKQGMDVQALYAQLQLPPSRVSSLQEDLNVQLHTDHGAERPAGAQSTPLGIETADTSGQVWVTLPLENAALSSAQMNRLKVYAKYPDGTAGYVQAALTSYNEKYKHGMKFALPKSGQYTIILPASSKK
ncbi:hypothetical protein [Paenibacillus dauci]|uniref:hypothetical protein n=1 Tax=Paenibacillus dauci TaxID=1567106 RepID=UPI000619E60F|nr:hypothetical protein [Paenibacillus dauci]